MKKAEPATTSKSKETMDIDSTIPDDVFGNTSYIIQSEEGKSIHKENVELLKRCGQQDIMDEQQKLLKTLGNIFYNQTRFFPKGRSNFICCPFLCFQIHL